MRDPQSYSKCFDLLMVEQIILSPEVKQSIIIRNKLVYTNYRVT